MKFKILIIAIIIIGTVSSCNKNSWLDVNTNPNTLPSSTSNFTFASAANRTAAASIGSNELGYYWSGQWTQSNSYSINNSVFAYQFTNGDFNFWDGYYDILEDLQYSIDAAVSSGTPYFGGTSRIMKAYIYQMMVDLYGNLPYSEALKGSAILTPKYDDQKFIYEDLIKVLDTAITILRDKTVPAALALSDIVFGANVSTSNTRWIQFANSLKLRLLIRQSGIPGRANYIIAEINKAAATTEGFLQPGVDVTSNPGYIATAGKLNPFYESYGYNASGGAQSYGRYPRPTQFLFNSLIAAKDTFRLKRLAFPKGGEGVNAEIVSNYVGIPFGATTGFLSQNTSYIGPSQIKKFEYNRPMILMTNSESQFLLAEAKELYGASVTLPLTAQAYYEEGVRQSFRLTGTTSAYGATRASTLLTNGINLSDWNASPDKLKAIWMQKWIALVNYNGLEAWSEYRRTNFPLTPPSLAASPTAPRPVRLYYTLAELASNTTNVLAQGTINAFTTKIFWDIN